jgi:hypothetical protein
MAATGMRTKWPMRAAISLENCQMNDRRWEIESKFKFVLTHATFVRGKMPDRKNFRKFIRIFSR